MESHAKSSRRARKVSRLDGNMASVADKCIRSVDERERVLLLSRCRTIEDGAHSR